MPDTDLISFLKARLDEDEQVARRIKATRHGTLMAAPGDGESPSVIAVEGDKLLREVEVKRRIIDREEEKVRERWRQRVDEHRLTFEVWISRWPPETLRLLALPHVHHKDFREEWRP